MKTAIDSLLASDSAIIRGIGDMLKALMSAMGMYNSPEGAGAETGKE